jgi:hypothetical protein
MKKKYLLVLVTISMNINNILAQYNKFEFGIEGAPMYSYVNETSYWLKPGFGFYVGTSFQYGFNRYLSIKTGTSFNQNNYKLWNNIVQGWPPKYIPKITIYKLNYLSIPLLLKVGIPLEKITIYANVGPYLGYLLSEESTITIGSGSPYTENQISKFLRVDLGVVYGLGISINIRKKYSLFVEARYNWGLTYALMNKNRSIGLLFGLSYKI